MFLLARLVLLWTFLVVVVHVVRFCWFLLVLSLSQECQGSNFESSYQPWQDHWLSYQPWIELMILCWKLHLSISFVSDPILLCWKREKSCIVLFFTPLLIGSAHANPHGLFILVTTQISYQVFIKLVRCLFVVAKWASGRVLPYCVLLCTIDKINNGP